LTDPSPDATAADPDDRRIVNLSAPVIAVAAAMVLGFLAQGLAPEGAGWLGVSSAALAEGRWWTLLSSIFVHAGWWHLLANLGALLAFGEPLARRLGPGARGLGLFVLFFLVCGALSGLGFVVLNLGGVTPAVGASGAIFGLWGATTRVHRSPDGLWPLLSAPVRSTAIAVAISNAVLVASLATLGKMSDEPVMMIAWEAHAAGFIAGLLLVGPFLRLAGTLHPRWPAP
jgi:membrane associated rhomboid family serine protease